MVKCSFCSRHIEIGRGLIYVGPSRIFNFCSSKCRKNYELGREPKKIAWVRKLGKEKIDVKKEILEEAEEKAEKEVEAKLDKEKLMKAEKEEKQEEKSEKK